MFSLTKIHALAALRGNGLRPELVDHFRQHQARHLSDLAIAEITATRSRPSSNRPG